MDFAQPVKVCVSAYLFNILTANPKTKLGKLTKGLENTAN